MDFIDVDYLDEFVKTLKTNTLFKGAYAEIYAKLKKLNKSSGSKHLDYIALASTFFDALTPDYAMSIVRYLTRERIDILFTGSTRDFDRNIFIVLETIIRERGPLQKSDHINSETQLLKVARWNKTFVSRRNVVTLPGGNELREALASNVVNDMNAYKHKGANYSIVGMLTSGIPKNKFTRTKEYEALLDSLVPIRYSASFDDIQAQAIKLISIMCDQMYEESNPITRYGKEGVYMYDLTVKTGWKFMTLTDASEVYDPDDNTANLEEVANLSIFGSADKVVVPFSKKAFIPKYITVMYDEHVVKTAGRLDDALGNVMDLSFYDKVKNCIEGTYCGASGVEGQAGRLRAGLGIYALGNPLSLFNEQIFPTMPIMEKPLIPTSSISIPVSEDSKETMVLTFKDYTDKYFTYLDQVFFTEIENREHFDEDFLMTLAKSHYIHDMNGTTPFDSINMKSSSGLPYNTANEEVVSETINNADFLFRELVTKKGFSKGASFIKISPLQTKIECVDIAKKGVKERNICPGHMCHMLPTLFVYHAMFDSLTNPMRRIAEAIRNISPDQKLTFNREETTIYKALKSGSYMPAVYAQVPKIAKLIEEIIVDLDGNNIIALHKFSIAGGNLLALHILAVALPDGLYSFIYSDNIYLMEKSGLDVSWCSLDGSSFESSNKSSLLMLNSMYVMSKMGWGVTARAFDVVFKNFPDDTAILSSNFATEPLMADNAFYKLESSAVPKTWAAFFFKQAAITKEKIVAWGNEWIGFPGLPSGEPLTYLHNTVLALLGANSILDYFYSSEMTYEEIMPVESIIGFDMPPEIDLKKNGLKLTGELYVLPENCSLSLNEPGLYLMDLLGYDTLKVEIEGFLFTLPVLAQNRFWRSLCFPIYSPTASRVLKELDPFKADNLREFLNLMRYRVLQIAGGWYYCNELMIELQRISLHKLGILDPDSMNDDLVTNVYDSISDLFEAVEAEMPITKSSIKGVVGYMVTDAMCEAVRIFGTTVEYMEILKYKKQINFADRYTKDQIILSGNYELSSFRGHPVGHYDIYEEKEMSPDVEKAYKEYKTALKERDVEFFRPDKTTIKIRTDSVSNLLMKDHQPFKQVLVSVKAETAERVVNQAVEWLHKTVLSTGRQTFVVPMTIAETIKYYHESFDTRMSTNGKRWEQSILINRVAQFLFEQTEESKQMINSNKVDFTDAAIIWLLNNKKLPDVYTYPLPLSRMIYYRLPAHDIYADGMQILTLYETSVPKTATSQEYVAAILGLKDVNEWFYPVSVSDMVIMQAQVDVEAFFERDVPKLVLAQAHSRVSKMENQMTREKGRKLVDTVSDLLVGKEANYYGEARKTREKAKNTPFKAKERARDKAIALRKKGNQARRDKKQRS